MNKHEQGLTLIEVLATFVLTFVIGTLVFSVATTAINHYKHSEIQSQTQSEVNQLILNLTDIHQNYTHYTISRINSSTYVVETPDTSYTFHGEASTYDIYIAKNLWSGGDLLPDSILLPGESISINGGQTYEMFISVTKPEVNRFKPVEVSTSISRISTSESSDES
ncbi:PulJ/GspJ family protein [Tenuibacillus multivorans]|uniref:Prepilin-type N-terminal cleavage/methylation domain-containing protein n=1 Tax=Tenuibacillus multivorans TaxID=237069 RepID=A0A1H0FZM6_9BACI|nr:hypothetical protein [Tenuibacillus multivorans]GEL78141.1 hypothetical protein TMU01_23760 [Tenuibacillus multivorans]SDO00128.1 hypothetical protein SAMN05216498_0415 [Tenuibacillus multivorans]